uniref:Col_cuticle_N domain-containing protein n=1 Tax=Panagrellus redivivus TaxID=6233 RepID=A0A7E4UP59_PANRE
MTNATMTEGMPTSHGDGRPIGTNAVEAPVGPFIFIIYIILTFVNRYHDFTKKMTQTVDEYTSYKPQFSKT